MIDLNKQKQAEMKRFTGWLERLLKVSMDDVTGKTKLKNYLGDYQKSETELTFAELEDILYKNKSKLGISLNDARLMAKLRDEYEKSLAVLRPLKKSLPSSCARTGRKPLKSTSRRARSKSDRPFQAST